MKRTLLTVCFILFAVAAFTQTLTFGVKGGLNLSSQTLKSPSFDINGGNLAGFHLGGILDIGFDNFSVQPGLFFTTKGEKLTSQLLNSQGQNAGSSSDKVKLNYLELPVNLLYKVKLKKGTAVYFGGGPYIGLGLSGTVSLNGNSGDVHFGKNDGDYKNPDYGVSFTAGVELNSIIIGADYGLGLGNVSHAQGATLHNNVLGFSVGYLFK